MSIRPDEPTLRVEPTPSVSPGLALVCSSRGCHASANWGLQWNNPALHTPERRKVWLACDEHRTTLSDFLTVRGFLREVVPVSELGPQQR